MKGAEWGVEEIEKNIFEKMWNRWGKHIFKKNSEEGLIEALEQQDRQQFSNGPRLTRLWVYSQSAPPHNTHIVLCAKEPKQRSTPQGAA